MTRLINTEIVTLAALDVDKIRKRRVPVVATSVSGAVVIALVTEPLTMVVMAPVQAPVASVQVPAQRCIVTVLGETDAKVC